MAWQGRGKTAVVGGGFSKPTRNPEGSLGTRTLDACRAAIADAGVAASEVDGIVTYPDQPFRGAGNRDGEDLVTVQFMKENGGLAPDIRWWAQISTGSIPSAVIEGVNALLAGACNYVLVWRAMHLPKGTYGAFRSDRATGESQFTAPYGYASPFQAHALRYRRYMNDYGATREQMATLVANTSPTMLSATIASWQSRNVYL